MCGVVILVGATPPTNLTAPDSELRFRRMILLKNFLRAGPCVFAFCLESLVAQVEAGRYSLRIRRGTEDRNQVPKNGRELPDKREEKDSARKLYKAGKFKRFVCVWGRNSLREGQSSYDRPANA